LIIVLQGIYNKSFIQDTEYTLPLKKGPTIVFGTIAAVSVDNPASSALGGFKEGSQAYRFFHHCYITLNEIEEI